MTNRFFYILLTVIASAFDVVATEPVKQKNSVEHKVTEDLYSDAFSMPSIVTAAGMELLMSDDRGNSVVVDDMIEFAKKHMGTRYRRGGKSPAGFDCSGFTSYVFDQFGYKLGSSSRDQYLQGEPIEKEAVMPGDLLFFNGRSIGLRVGHVGIAIDSDPETGVVTFIHAAIAGGIRIDKTSAPYYSRRYLGARRVICPSQK